MISAPNQKVMIFDSGGGGLSVSEAIVAAQLPLDLYYLADFAGFPYGKKEQAELAATALALITSALDLIRPAALVLACNTASTALLPMLRAQTQVPIIGVVPAIKPASLASQSQVIAVLATPGTIQSQYLETLRMQSCPETRLIPCADAELVSLIELWLSRARKPWFDPDIKAQLRRNLSCLHEQAPNIDQLVLACTHFPLVKHLFEQVLLELDWAVHLVDSGQAIARRLGSLLSLQAEPNPRVRQLVMRGPDQKSAGASSPSIAPGTCERAQGYRDFFTRLAGKSSVDWVWLEITGRNPCVSCR